MSVRQARVELEITPDLQDTTRGRVIHEDSALSDPFSMLYHWTWTIPLSPHARVLYHYLLFRAGSRGHCWPPRPDISRDTGISERKVHDLLHELEDAGLIEIVDRRFEWKPTDYVILRKERVMERRGLLQNLQEGHVAEPARPSRRTCKSKLQSLQEHKRQVDTGIDTPTNTPSLGADKPRPTRSTPKSQSSPEDRVSTEHDPDAAPDWRLALKVCRVVGWATAERATVKKLACFMAWCLRASFDPARYESAEDHVLGFLCWLDSGADPSTGQPYWRGKGYMANAGRLRAEWNDWVGQDEPESKPERKERPRTAGGRLLDPAEIAARSSRGEL